MRNHLLLATAALAFNFLPGRASAAIEIADVLVDNNQLHVVFEETGDGSNLFTLQETADLVSPVWSNLDGASLDLVDGSQFIFSLPLDSVGPDFYRIVGTFLSGAPAGMTQVEAGSLPAASTLGPLGVPAFFMAGTEVTWTEWTAVREWAAGHGYDIGSSGAACGPNHPVHSVSFHDVLKWCNARSEQAGLNPVYRVGGNIYRTGETIPEVDANANGYRLPTEEEWEFAARGGSLSQGYTYSGSDNLDAVGWYADNTFGADCDLSGSKGTFPVGQKAANELGLVDMSGNVAEWCWKTDGDPWQVRGGSWSSDASGCSMAIRGNPASTSGLDTVGFRLSRGLSNFAANQAPIVSLTTPTDNPVDPVDVYLVGDSTVMTYGSGDYPMRGWGQELPHFISNSHFVIQNRAIGGRSSRSFIEEGRWDSVKAELEGGDYVMIQFGHNDRDTRPERYTSPEDFKNYISQYVIESRAIGAEPVLVTPMVMNAWDQGGMRNVFTEDGSDYAGAMKEVADTLSVPLLDLNAKSHAFFSALDADTNSRFYYNTYVAGEYPNYPDGLSDGTHFQQMGALVLCKMIAEEIRDQAALPDISRLANALMPQYPVSIKANDPAAGRVTRSTELPAGVTFTLKALPGEGHSFINWKDGDNNLVETQSLTSFVLGQESLAFIAYFDNEEAVSAPPPGTLIPGGPHSGRDWMAGDRMEFTAHAFDPDGSISMVEYFAGDSSNKIGDAAFAPYQFNWIVESGTYEVWAEAVDNEGLRSRSAGYFLDVPVLNLAPTISITSPEDESAFLPGTELTVSADAADSDGTVTAVEFYYNGNLLGEVTSSPYSLLWSGLEQGIHSLSAIAYDDDGEASAPSTITVAGFYEDGGSLLQEAEDGILVGSFVAVEDAEASGGFAVEAVSGPAASNYVELRFNVPTSGFYAIRTLVKSIDGLSDTMFVSVDGGPATQYLWDAPEQPTGYFETYVNDRGITDQLQLDLTAGPHYIRFGYREHFFLDLVELEFLAPRPDNYLPSVSITSPADGAIFDVGQAITLAADASDPDGFVDRVEFFADGELIGTANAAPYTIDWSDAQSGTSHEFVAVVWDDYGDSVSSDPVNVTILYENGDLEQETEGATLAGSATVVADASASGGEYVHLGTPDGDPGPGANYIEFNFNVPRDDIYNLVLTYRAPDEASNSVYISVDGADPQQYLVEMPVSADWTTDMAVLSGEVEPLVLELPFGGRTIRLGFSEPIDIDHVELREDPGIGYKVGRTYNIVNVGSGLVLEAVSQIARQGTDEFASNQRWTVEESLPGYFNFFLEENGEALDNLAGDPVGTGTFASNRTSQIWRINPVGDGTFTLAAFNSTTGTVLTPMGLSDQESAFVIHESYVGDPHQHWVFVNPGAPEPPAHTVYLLGDSTVADYASTYYPQTGWGQVLQRFFDSAVNIENRAIGGTSSKSFYESFWEPVRSQLKPGDFVFIGFGINDAANDARYTEPFGTFQDYLTAFVNDTKAAGAHPVIVSTVRRNAWNNTDPPTLYDAYHDYPVASRQLAQELDLPLIDLDQLTVPFLEGLGPDYTGPFLYMNLQEEEYPNFSAGAADNVHFQEMGAIEMARLVVDGIQLLSGDPNLSELIPYIQPTYEVQVSNANPGQGIVTRTASYPIDLNITVKALPSEGFIFDHWEDGLGNEISTEPLIQFLMGPETHNYVAYFDVAPPPGPDPETNIIPGAYYTISNASTGLFLTNASGTQLTQETATGAGNQQFVMTKNAEGYYSLTLPLTGQTVNAFLFGGVVMADPSEPPSASQHWTVTYADGKHTFEARNYAGSLLGVSGNSDSAGAVVNHSSDGGTDYQRWILTLVE